MIFLTFSKVQCEGQAKVSISSHERQMRCRKWGTTSDGVRLLRTVSFMIFRRELYEDSSEVSKSFTEKLQLVEVSDIERVAGHNA